MVALPPKPARKRNATICSFDCAHPQSAVNVMKMMFPIRMIRVRPHISEHGESTKGPKAYVNMKIDITMLTSEEELMCSSSPIELRAGAAIEEERGDRNAKADTVRDI